MWQPVWDAAGTGVAGRVADRPLKGGPGVRAGAYVWFTRRYGRGRDGAAAAAAATP